MISPIPLKLVVLSLIVVSIAAPSKKTTLTAAPSVTASATPTTTVATTTTKTLAGPGQLCGGGVGWTGPTECVPPYLCIKENPLYWWCY